MVAHEFKNLTLPHLDAVYRLALQWTRRPELACELVQETYLNAQRAYRGSPQESWLVRPRLFKILLQTISRRLGTTEPDADRREETRETEALRATRDDASPPRCPEILNGELDDERLRKTIASLPMDCQSMLLLWGVEKMTYREIAEIEDTTVETAMKRLHDARELLAERLTNRDGDPPDHISNPPPEA